MKLRELSYNIYNYVYFIIVISALVLYGINFGDYKEDSRLCAYQYDDYTNNNIGLKYWKGQYNSCCHYTLNEDNNIIADCK